MKLSLNTKESCIFYCELEKEKCTTTFRASSRETNKAYTFYKIF